MGTKKQSNAIITKFQEQYFVGVAVVGKVPIISRDINASEYLCFNIISLFAVHVCGQECQRYIINVSWCEMKVSNDRPYYEVWSLFYYGKYC